MSIIQQLYKPYTCPLARVVCGLPITWGESLATRRFQSSTHNAAWSPCSRYIAVAWSGFDDARVEILDAVTLGQCATLGSSLEMLGETQQLIFSPGACLLTWVGKDPWKILSWDLQTGVLVSAISPGPWRDSPDCSSATYSVCGTMFGVMFCSVLTSTICTYNILSGTLICSHLVEGLVLHQISTHSGCLWFGTAEPESITMWEVGFASMHVPTEVGSFPIPDNFTPSQKYLFHPTLPHLAFVVESSVFIWDTHDSKFLLNFMNFEGEKSIKMSFSHDGHFSVCGTVGSEIYLWKNSPTGYIPHKMLIPDGHFPVPLISPNGESIIVVGHAIIQLWQMTHPTISTQDPQESRTIFIATKFVLGFSPDEGLAAVALRADKMVVVLNLKSGVPQLTIDTSMSVYGLGVAGRTVVAASNEKIVAWELPIGDCTPNPQVNVGDNIWTTTYSYPSYSHRWGLDIAVSPTLHHIAIIGINDNEDPGFHLHLYDIHNGQHLWHIPLGDDGRPGFSPSGHEIWCCSSYEVYGWKIVEDSESNTTRLEGLEPTTPPPDDSPWGSLYGYKITDSGWVLHSSGKRLLWLPPQLQMKWWIHRMWSGQFLVLLANTLPEVVILELE